MWLSNCNMFNLKKNIKNFDVKAFADYFLSLVIFNKYCFLLLLTEPLFRQVEFCFHFFFFSWQQEELLHPRYQGFSSCLSSGDAITSHCKKRKLHWCPQAIEMSKLVKSLILPIVSKSSLKIP